MSRNGFSLILVIIFIAVVLLFIVVGLYFYSVPRDKEINSNNSVTFNVELKMSPLQKAAQNATYPNGIINTSSPDYRRWLTSSTPESPFDAPQQEIDTVTNWFSSRGIAPAWPNQTSFDILMNATPNQTLQVFSQTITSNCGDASFPVPADLSSTVESIWLTPCTHPL
jgi:hypothetical protein